VGTRKALALLEAGATVRVISPVVSALLTELESTTDRLSIHTSEYSGSDDIADADVVIAATHVAELNARVAADARTLHRIVLVASSPDEGTFTSMAVHRTGPLAIGVSAGNVPAAAARIRDAIAERFDERYGSAVALCSEMRSSTLAGGGRDEWARTSDALIGADFCRRVESGAFEQAAH
jgi:siroheme synthase-like protein